MRDRGLGVIMISHNMEDVRAVADRVVVLRLGRNNGVFTPDASNQELVSAITGATNNSVSRRASRRRPSRKPAQEARHEQERSQADGRCSTAATSASSMTTGIGGAVSAFLDRVRSGDLGSLPVVVGLVYHLDGLLRASIRSSCRRTTSSTCCSTARRSA